MRWVYATQVTHPVTGAKHWVATNKFRTEYRFVWDTPEDDAGPLRQGVLKHNRARSFKIPEHPETNAHGCHLYAVVLQSNRPIAFVDRFRAKRVAAAGSNRTEPCWVLDDYSKKDVTPTIDNPGLFWWKLAAKGAAPA